MKGKIKQTKKGFTLIELLVVIAIIAILSVVVILTLNPAELLRQSRDSNRVSDMSVLKSAISFYLADVSAANINIGTSTYLYGSNGGGSTSSYIGGTGWGFATSDVPFWGPTSTNRSNNGSGWLPVNFTLISSGAPIGNLPIDPSNAFATTITNGSNVYLAYMYVASGTNFKFATKTESSKYSTNGAGDVESGDGGQSTSTFEAGTLLTL